MKTTVKLLALALLLGLSSTALVACGGEPAPTESPASPS